MVPIFLSIHVELLVSILTLPDRLLNSMHLLPSALLNMLATLMKSKPVYLLSSDTRILDNALVVVAVLAYLLSLANTLLVPGLILPMSAVFVVLLTPLLAAVMSSDYLKACNPLLTISRSSPRLKKDHGPRVSILALSMALLVMLPVSILLRIPNVNHWISKRMFKMSLKTQLRLCSTMHLRLIALHGSLISSSHSNPPSVLLMTLPLDGSLPDKIVARVDACSTDSTAIIYAYLHVDTAYMFCY
jgi:hypothetical protein